MALKILMFYIVTVLTLPLIATFLLTMYVYKEFCFFLLRRLRNCSEIVMLDSADSFWRVGQPHHNVIDTIIVINSKTENFDDFVSEVKQNITEKILNKSKTHPKLSSVLSKFMGYSYLIKTDVKADQFIRTIDMEEIDVFNEKSLTEILSEHVGNNKLPINNTFLWEIVIVKANKDWKNKNSLEENQIPIFLRVNHIIGDGLSLMNLMVHSFNDNKKVVSQTLTQMFKKNKNEKSSFRIFLETVHLILIAPGFLIDTLIKGKENLWNPPLVRHERRFFCASEKPDDGTIKLIKSVKSEIGNTGFTDILLTTISASLASYFKKFPRVPENALMALIYFEALLTSLSSLDGIPELKNQFVYLLLNIPISGAPKTLLQRLKMIKTERKTAESTPQLKVNHMVFNKISGIFPDIFIPYLVPLDKISVVFSNLPGLTKMSLWNKHEIDNIYFFIPSRHQLVTIFNLITYNNKVHMGLAVDRAVFPSDVDCQNIVNGVLDNIVKFKDELKNTNNNNKD